MSQYTTSLQSALLAMVSFSTLLLLLQSSECMCRTRGLREVDSVTRVGSKGNINDGTSSHLSSLPLEFSKCSLHTYGCCFKQGQISPTNSMDPLFEY